jgi:oxaloacetate decarboxylase alpha subunit
MTGDTILSIAPVMDKVGYKRIAVGGGRALVVASRDLHENFFERLRVISKTITKTPLRSAFYTWGPFGFDIEPLAPMELWIRHMVANGIRSFWVCDYQNLMDRLSHLVQIAKAEGAEVVAAIMYALSPVHTDELFARKTRMLAEMGGVDAIQMEDASGVLTPERTRTLVPAMQRESKGLPIEFHSHCNIGLANQSYLEAVKLGVNALHTAVSPLANDTSLPSAENVLRNIHCLGYSSNLDEDCLKVVSEHFRKIGQESGMRIGVPLEYDLFHFEHQIPGGMMGSLRNQLSALKMEGRLMDVMKETAKVRKELGYPVMATPYSQIVGAQAVYNIASGERYKMCANEIIKYALGFYGEPDSPMDQNVKDKILGSPNAKKFLNWKPAEITVQDLRKIEPGLSDDELLLRIADPQGEFRDKLYALYGKK